MRGENTLPHCLTRVAAAGGADVVLMAGHASRADFCRGGRNPKGMSLSAPATARPPHRARFGHSRLDAGRCRIRSFKVRAPGVPLPV